jgi:hypothetical protein
VAMTYLLLAVTARQVHVRYIAKTGWNNY